MPFPFPAVCDLLQSLENDLKRKRQQRGSADITKDWFAAHRDCIHAPGTDPVALLSTLLPERRTDRVFALKEKSLERIVATACGLGTRKGQLRRWETEPRAGLDFAECVEYVLAQAPNEVHEPVSVERIDETLQQLASAVSFSSPAVKSTRLPASRTSGSKEHLLAHLFRSLSPRDAKWFCRVVLKTFLPVIVPEFAVYSAFHSLLPTVLKIHDNFSVAVQLLQHHLAIHQARGLGLSHGDITRIIKPQVGVKVGRQQWCKARGIKHGLEMGTGYMSCETKMDGEYCQIHIDLSKGRTQIQIFSKSGKDSTMDRCKLHPAIRASLRLGTEACKFKKQCILEGELVVYNELEKKIAVFDKIRKHVNRSGRFIGNSKDSQAHSYERLMIVYFDVLLVDDSMLNMCHLERRKRLSSLVHCQEGQAALVESRVINFSSRTAEKDLRKVFASSIRAGEEGLVLKPNEPYFSFGRRHRSHQSCCLKLKKGYVKGLGDVGDFAVVGGRFDPTAAKVLGLSNIKFTHFYLGCLTNKEHATRFQDKPAFKVVAEVKLSSIMAEYFRTHVFVMEVPPEDNDKLVIEAPDGVMGGKKMSAVFVEPAVFDVTCFDFHRESNTDFWSPRFPYVSKIHIDRTWKECLAFDELQSMAQADETRKDENESQELSDWIKKLEESESRRRRKAESQCSRTDDPGAVASMPEGSQDSVIQTSALAPSVPPVDTNDPMRPVLAGFSSPHPSHTLEPSGPSLRKRRRDDSPTATRHAKQRTDVIVLTPSQTPSATQHSLRQPLDDITSAASSQGNALPSSAPRLSGLETFHEESQAAKSSPLPERPANAASVQTAEAFSRPCEAPRKAAGPLLIPTQPGARSTPIPGTICRDAGTSCVLAEYFILLSPCVANMPLLTETLLPSHGVRATFSDMPSWQASAAFQGVSSGKPARLVLVEARRKDQTREFLRKLTAEPLRPRNGGAVRVLVYDWRLVEAITDAELAQKKSDGSGTRQKVGTGAWAKEIWKRHYIGVC